MDIKMKIFGVLLVLLTIVVAVNAVEMPFFYGGQITLDGEPLPNIRVYVTNLDTEEVIKTVTDAHGYYQIDMLTAWKKDLMYKSDRYVGDRIRFGIVENSEEYAVEKILPKYNEKLPQKVHLVYLSDKEPEVVEKIRFVCWDGSEVTRKNDCPTQPVPDPVPVYVCPDGSEVETAEDCPVPKDDYQDEIVIGLITALLLVMVGLLENKYKWCKGFAGFIKYYIKKRDFKRAIKMMKTVIQKAKEGKYKR